MQFCLFLIANGLLFLRPAELIAELHGVEIYRYVLAACLAFCFPSVLQQLSLRYPGVPPIAGCVLGLLPCVMLSNLFGGNQEGLVENAIEFFKLMVYFLVMLALLTDFSRLKQFFFWFTLFAAGLAAIAVVRYHGDLALPEPPAPAVAAAGGNKANGTFVVERIRDRETGEWVAVRRMCGTGIFNDPNDLGLALVVAMPICCFWLGDPERRAFRPAVLGLLALFFYALILTQSRGGLLAFLAMAAVLAASRFGLGRTLVLAALALPPVLVLSASRITTISSDEATAQSRIALWNEGFDHFRTSPLFGIGMDNYHHLSSHVAHNSFIHSYSELGLLGGTLFLGGFYFALRGLWQARPSQLAFEEDDLDPDLLRFHPYLLAMLVAYMVGISFLSLCYIVPTYLILGAVIVYLRLVQQSQPVPVVDFRRYLLPHLTGVSLTFLFGMYTFVRVFLVVR